MRKIFLPLILLFFSSPVVADAFETGQDLYLACEKAINPAKRNDLAFGLCMGYIDGYISGYRFKREINNSPKICNDIETRSRREVLTTVVDYLKAHPESQQEIKSIAMYQAMLDKMTCP